MKREGERFAFAVQDVSAAHPEREIKQDLQNPAYQRFGIANPEQREQFDNLIMKREGEKFAFAVQDVSAAHPEREIKQDLQNPAYQQFGIANPEQRKDKVCPTILYGNRKSFVCLPVFIF